jgi:hypothetical protein
MIADGNAYGYEHPVIDWLNLPGIKVSEKLNLIWYEDAHMGDTYIYKFSLTERDVLGINKEDRELNISELARSHQ